MLANRPKRTTMFFVMAMAACGLGAGDVQAKTDVSKFPLTKAFPDDAFIAVAVRHNPEQKFLTDYWKRVTDALHESGVGSDIWDMIADLMPDEQAEQIEATMERFGKLFEKIEWDHLFEKEFLHVGRFSGSITSGSPYEGVIIGRMDAAKVPANYQNLKSVLDEISLLVNQAAAAEPQDAEDPADDATPEDESDEGEKDEGGPRFQQDPVKRGEAQNRQQPQADDAAEGLISVVEDKIDGGKIARLTVRGYPGGSILSVGHTKDLIIISMFGDRLVTDCLDLLNGKSKKTRLIETPRFKSAVDALPNANAEDAVVFFDVSRMLDSISKMVASIEQLSANEPETKQIVSLIQKLLHDVSLVDYTFEAGWTDGYRVFTDSVTVLKPDAKGQPLYKVVTSGGTVENFARFIPQNADSFSVSTGIDLAALYRYIIDFAKEHMPDGEENMARWTEMQKEWELDFEEDVCGLFAGPSSWVTMGNEWAILIEVTDETKARKQVDRLFDKITELMGEQGGLIRSPATVAGKKNFEQVSHPMLMMMGGGMAPPVWGCADGHLILGSSGKTLTKVLETAGGKNPNITKSKRFQSEAIAPGSGKLDSITFTDESRMAEQLQEAVGGIATMMGFAGMAAQQAPPQVRTIITTIPTILGKLVPVVGEIDFFQSSASVSTFNNDKWVTHSVQNYKDPKSLSKEEPDQGISEPDATEE